MGKRARVTRPATEASRPRSSKWQDSIALRGCLVAFIGALMYANSLHGAFIFDDHLSIEENRSIRQLRPLSAVLAPERELPVAGRPVVNVSLALNYAVGGLDVRGYHVVNIALHLVCGVLLFGSVRRTLLLPSLRSRFGHASGNVAFAAALLWTVHPLNTEVVNYVTQRTESLMASCYLLTLYAAIRSAHSRHPGAWHVLACIACALGMGSKESMATAPLMIALYDRVFLYSTFREALRGRWRLYAGLVATWPVLGALMWSGPRIHSAGFLTGLRVDTYLLNQGPMILRYLYLTAWPRSLVSDYGTPLALTLGQVWPQMAALVLLLAAAGVALFRQPSFGFLAAWFFITLAPSSSFVPIATEVGAERRMYLPLMALMVMATILARVGWERMAWMRDRSTSRCSRASEASWTALVLLVSALLAFGSVLRNRDYRSPLTLATTVLDRWPTARAHHAMAVALLTAGRRDEAMAHLHEAVDGDPRAHYTLGGELFKDNRLEDAIVELNEFVRREPMLMEVVSARDMMGQAFLRLGRPAEALDQFQTILRMVPSYVLARAGLARAMLAQNDYEGAIRESREFLAQRPNDVLVLTNLAVALAATNRPDAAIAAFAKVTELAPADADAHRNLAKALLEKHDFERAAEAARRAAALNPRDAVAHGILGIALAGQGRFDTAIDELRLSVSLDPNDADIRQNLTAIVQMRRDDSRR